MRDIRIERLTGVEVARARALFLTMAEVFETESRALSDEYVSRLLERPDFWALAASVDGTLAGGLTAFTLPLTRREGAEVLLYDIAVRPEYQRQGVGRQLVAVLRTTATAAGIGVVWVPAANEEDHALDFYRALGGAGMGTTIFTFGEDEG